MGDKTQSAKEQVDANTNEICLLVTELLEKTASLSEAKNPNWGHVGSLRAIVSGLNAILGKEDKDPK